MGADDTVAQEREVPMGHILRRTRAVIRQFDESIDIPGTRRERTEIVDTPVGAELHIYLRSSEVFGVWLVRYKIAYYCFCTLQEEGLIESLREAPDGEVFVLSQKGRARLRQS